FIERGFPGASDVDAEMPRRGHVAFIAADDAAGLVVGGIEAMRVDRRGRRLQPDMRRIGGARDGLADGMRRLDARVHDLALVLRVVAAIDATTGQIDDDVRAVDDVRQVAPWNAGAPADDDHLASRRAEVFGQQSAEVASASGDDDLRRW